MKRRIDVVLLLLAWMVGCSLLVPSRTLAAEAARPFRGGDALSVADARSAATAGLDLHGEGAATVLLRPQDLALGARSGVLLGRVGGIEGIGAEPEASVLGWRTVGPGSAWGFTLAGFDRRVPTDDSLDVRRLDGTFGWAWLIDADGRWSLGQSYGWRHVSDDVGATVQGVTTTGLGFRATSWLHLSQAGSVVFGDGQPDVDIFSWSARSVVRVGIDSRGIATGLELRTGTDFDARDDVHVRWGLEVDPLRALRGGDASPPQGSVIGPRLQIGHQPDGTSVGATVGWGGTSLSLVRAPWGKDVTATVFAFTQRWGDAWTWQRRHDRARNGRIREDNLERIDRAIAAGAYADTDIAFAVLDTLDMEAGHREDVERRRRTVQSLRARARDADTLYRRSESTAAARQAYAALLEVSPRCSLFAQRIRVCERIAEGREHRRAKRIDQALAALDEAFELDPENPVVHGEMIATGRRITLQLECLPLQASLHRSYQSEPPLRLNVTSLLPFPLRNVRVVYSVDPYALTESNTVELGTLEDRVFDTSLPLVLDETAVARVGARETVKVSLQLQVLFGDQAYAIPCETTTEIHGRTAIDWDDPRQFAAAVGGVDRELARTVSVLPRDLASGIREWLPRWPESLVTSLAIHRWIRLAGVSYTGESPYLSGLGRTQRQLDRLRLPKEILETQSADCEDLVGLWLAALQARGIGGAYVVERQHEGHVMLLVDLGVAPTRGATLCGLEAFALERKGRLWLPVETTVLRGTFLEAVRQGHAFATDPRLELTREEYFLEDVHRELPPPSWPETPFESPVSVEEIREGMTAELREFRTDYDCGLPELGSLVAPVPGTARPGPGRATVVESARWSWGYAPPRRDGGVRRATASGRPSTIVLASPQAQVAPSPPASGVEDATCEVRPLDPSMTTSSCIHQVVMGNRLAKNGRTEAATKYFLEGLACGRSRAAALCNLGNVALILADDPRRALELYECAAELDGEDPGITMNRIIAHTVLASRGEDASEQETRRLAATLPASLDAAGALALVGIVHDTGDGTVAAEGDPVLGAWRTRIVELVDGEEAATKPRSTTALPVGREEDVIYWKEVEPEPK